MVALISIDELRSRIRDEELSQIAGVGSHNLPEGRALDEPAIVLAIAFASDLITGYLCTRYPSFSTLDANSTPDLIKGYASDIVRYRLRVRSESRNTVSEEVRKRYEDAISFLKDVSRGTTNLNIAGLSDNNQGSFGSHGSVKSFNPPARAEQTLRGY